MVVCYKMLLSLQYAFAHRSQSYMDKMKQRGKNLSPHMNLELYIWSFCCASVVCQLLNCTSIVHTQTQERNGQLNLWYIILLWAIANRFAKEFLLKIWFVLHNLINLPMSVSLAGTLFIALGCRHCTYRSLNSYRNDDRGWSRSMILDQLSNMAEIWTVICEGHNTVQCMLHLFAYVFGLVTNI